MGVYQSGSVQTAMCSKWDQNVSTPKPKSKMRGEAFNGKTVLPNGIRTTGSLLIRPQKRVS